MKTFKDLKAGSVFQYRQAKRWSNHFTVGKVIAFDGVQSVLVLTPEGRRKVLIQRTTEVRITD
tara:strand:- start:313 stop:501 length:189 start_codon:yes stop_codon:yes gene_type:complete